MLKQRVLTALVLLAILLPALFYPSPLPFAIVVLVLMAAGAWEWGRMNGWGQVGALALGAVCVLLCAVSAQLGWLERPLTHVWVIGGALWVLGGAVLLRAGLEQAEAATANNTRLVLNVCFNYGGRWDIAQAAATLAARGDAITEASLNAAMALAHVPDPDLLIRTGGEMRLSNFLLWQAAYSELYFSERLWPDFDEAALDEAIAAYAARERRFGQTSEQRVQASA